MKIALFSWKFILALLLLFPITLSAQGPTPGQNVNMVSGTQWPGGDPFLRQQNEPSIAVSTRNPQHLLAGANDYRTVDLNLVDTVAIDELDGDAWLGVFKSFDGGQTWKSTLLPGFPQDLSSFGTSSPMKGFGAASDPVVRAGTNGMFYYSGIAFNRTTNLGGLFLTRFIDLNNKENGDASDPGYPRVPTTDPIRYLGTVEVDQGTATHFIDKPWIAVDIPRANAKTCTFNVPEDNNTTVVQSFPGGNVYIAYSVFTGTAPNMYSKIKFSKSADCGQTWSKPIVISHYRLNQGAEIAVDPETGHIFVSWRVFSVTSDSDSTDDDPDMTKDKIVLTESFDGGNTFVKAFPIRKLMPYSILTPSAHAMFDQNTSATEFRMQTSPTIALDDSGIPGKSGNVYVAWSERGVGPSADARIVLSTSHDGLNFSAPMAVDNSPLTDNDYPADGDSFSRGHQFMPAMTFAGGKLMLTYYDLRLDGTTGVYTPNSPFAPDPVGQFFEEDRLLVGDPAAALFAPYVDDAALTVRRHTLDVVVAQSNGGLQPVFKNARVSRYDFGLPGLGDTNLGTLQLEQLKFNPPNLPMFAQGTVPFIGDYTDVAAQPFVSTPGGVWIYNNPPRAPASSPVFYEVHASNQDVIPPPINPLTGLQDWTTYYPPPLPGQIASIYNGAPLPACVTGYEGDRNQNIYEVPITQGLTVSSPQNSKPLSTTLQRAFAILVQNSTNLQKYFALSIPTQPPGSFRIAGQNTAGGYASFQQALPNQPALPNPLPAPVTTALVAIPPHSGSTRSVFALSSSPIASITVNVNETDVNGNVLAGGLSSFIVLNADGTVPTLVNPDAAPGNTNINGVETYDISIVHPSINNISIVHPSVSAISIVHPGVEAISIVHPNLPNSAVVNQTVPDTAADSTVANSGILANNPVTDATYTITNNGNTSAAYTVKFAGTTPSVPVQLIVNQIYTTQTGANCQLVPVQQGIINVNAGTPQFTDPSQISIVHPAPSDATLLLSPGASAFITLRGQTDPVTMASVVNQVTPVVAPNAVNTNSTATTPPVVAPLFVATAALPNGAAGSAYTSSVAAYGGTPPYTWTPASVDGITLNANGSITGTPAAGTFNLVATVSDSSTPVQMASRALSITVTGPSLSNLSFVMQPINSTATVIMPAEVSVMATDNTDAAVSGVTINLSLGVNPGGGTLTGTTSAVTNQAGIAVFSELFVSEAGAGYTLVASATGVAPAISNPFNVLPQPPTPLSAIAQGVGTGLVLVKWNASPTTNTSSYNVYRSTTSGGPFTSKVGSTIAPTTTFLDTGLVAGTYYYAVTAVGPGGIESAVSNQVSGTVPVVPALDIVTGVLPNGITGVSYNASVAASGGTPPYSWTPTVVDGLSLASNGAVSGTTSIAGSFAFAVTVTDSTLPVNLSAGLEITINILPAPPTLVSSSVTSSTASLSWSASTTSNVTGYNVYRALSASGPFTTPLSTATNLSVANFTDAPVVTSTTYYYVVRVLAGGFESGFSTPLTANVGFTYEQLLPATPPSSGPGRCCSAMTYDPVSASTLLFGGYQCCYSVMGDTWKFQGGQWAQLLPTNPPPARSGAAMVYYPSANKIVLFGGSNLSTQDFNDTWVWDGSNSTWTQIFPAVSPSGAALVGRRFDSQGMAYDPNTGTIVMFGGIALNNTTFFNDTWVLSFNQVSGAWTWTQQSPVAPLPSARRTVLAPDPAGNVMLFGGTGLTGNLGDTWVWNGANWEQQFPATSPSARDLHNMTFDPGLGVVVLFAGANLSDTWTWDGANWTQVLPLAAPPNRYAFGMDYDSAERAIVIFGGFGNPIAQYDTWILTIVPPPTNLTPSSNGPNIVLNWTASPSSGVTAYNVYRSTISGGPYTNVGPLIAITSFADTTATSAGTTYYYVVTSVANGIEGPNSTEVSIVLPPQPPTLSPPILNTSNNIVLSWTASLSSGVTAYNVYRSTISGGPYTNVGPLVANTSFIDTTATSAGTTYYYVVTAVANGIGGPNSNEVFITYP